jgi:transposase
MARSQLVDDGLWELVKPLLVARTPQQTGRPRVSDRTAFTAIVFVLVRLGYLGEWSLRRSAVLG